MRKNYDFSKAKRNPYARRLKKQITIRLDEQTLQYFKDLSAEIEIPYQTLINLYLGECARAKKRPSCIGAMGILANFDAVSKNRFIMIKERFRILQSKYDQFACQTGFSLFHQGILTHKVFLVQLYAKP